MKLGWEVILFLIVTLGLALMFLTPIISAVSEHHW